MRKRSVRAAEDVAKPPLPASPPTFLLRPEDQPVLQPALQSLQAELGALLHQLGSAVRKLAAQASDPAEQRWEHLSFYAERDRRDGKFYLQNGARRGGRLEEGEALQQLGRVGWQLVAVVPACYNGEDLNHQLYLKRPALPAN